MRPHDDVRNGAFNAAEFAANLAMVHRGKGSVDYLEPMPFFRRTYLTEDLQADLAETGRASAERDVSLRIPQAWQWLMQPSQPEADRPATIAVAQGAGSDDELAARVNRRRASAGALFTDMDPGAWGSSCVARCRSCGATGGGSRSGCCGTSRRSTRRHRPASRSLTAVAAA